MTEILWATSFLVSSTFKVCLSFLEVFIPITPFYLSFSAFSSSLSKISTILLKPPPSFEKSLLLFGEPVGTIPSPYTFVGWRNMVLNGEAACTSFFVFSFLGESFSSIFVFFLFVCDWFVPSSLCFTETRESACFAIRCTNLGGILI